MVPAIYIAAQLLCFFAVYFLALEGREIALLIGGIIGFPLYGAMAVYEIRREKFFVSPVVVWLLFGLIYGSVLPIYIYAVITAGYELTFERRDLDIVPLLPLAYSFSILASVSFYLGNKLVELGAVKQITGRLNRINPAYKARPLNVFLLIALGWSIAILAQAGFPLRQFGHFSPTLIRITYIAPLIILVINTRWINGELRIMPAGKMMYVALGLLLLYLGFMALGSGMRHPFLRSLAVFLLGYMLQREIALRDRSTWISFKAMLVPGILSLSFVFLVLTILLPYGKQIARTGKFERDEEYRLLETSRTFPDSGVWTLPRRMTAPLSSAAAIINIADYIPIDEQTHRGVLIGIVPRALWPNKPWVTKGAYFSLVMESGGGRTEQEATTATALSFYGELYWSYGIWGVPIGMTLFGFIYGISFRVFAHNFPASPLRTFIAAQLLLPMMNWFEADAVANYVAIIFIWVVFSPFVVFGLPNKLMPGKRRDWRAFAASQHQYLARRLR